MLYRVIVREHTIVHLLNDVSPSRLGLCCASACIVVDPAAGETLVSVGPIAPDPNRTRRGDRTRKIQGVIIPLECCLVLGVTPAPEDRPIISHTTVRESEVRDRELIRIIGGGVGGAIRIRRGDVEGQPGGYGSIKAVPRGEVTPVGPLAGLVDHEAGANPNVAVAVLDD